MKGLNRGMEYIANGINGARDTKQSIIVAANSYDYIQNKVKKIEEIAWQNIKSEKPEEIHFDPNEIEPIVLKNRKDKIVSNDKFKERLNIKHQRELEDGGKIVQTKTDNKEHEER